MALANPRSAASSLGPQRKRRLPPVSRGASLATALARCQELLQGKQSQGDEAAVAACYLEMGDLYLAGGQAEQAGDMYRRSLQLSRRIIRLPSLGS